MSDPTEPDAEARSFKDAEISAPVTSPTRRPPARASKESWRPSKVDVLILVLAANLVATAGLGIRVYRGSKPTVVTVGVTQLTGEYVSKLATSNITPQEAAVRTQLFMSVAQDTVRRAASDKGVIVMARECVLAGEFADITPDVGRSVEATMAKTKSPLVPAVVPQLPPRAGMLPGPIDATPVGQGG
jgi:hypothetical protein